MNATMELARSAGTPPDDWASLPCRSTEEDLWFAESPDDLERAKALCTGCPIRGACFAAALRRGEPWGVWGGEIFERGVTVGRKRPRGRPRKVDAARALGRVPTGEVRRRDDLADRMTSR